MRVETGHYVVFTFSTQKLKVEVLYCFKFAFNFTVVTDNIEVEVRLSQRKDFLVRTSVSGDYFHISDVDVRTSFVAEATI